MVFLCKIFTHLDKTLKFITTQTGGLGFNFAIEMNSKSPQKGQGAQSNVHNRFEKYTLEQEDDFPNQTKTNFLEVFPKTIVNQVKSPDLSMEYSLNPYQGCEHGCSYCFARPTHEYWGYSAGIDFERKIMVKKKCTRIVRKILPKEKLQSKNDFLVGQYRLLPTD